MILDLITVIYRTHLVVGAPRFTHTDSPGCSQFSHQGGVFDCDVTNAAEDGDVNCTVWHWDKSCTCIYCLVNKAMLQ